MNIKSYRSILLVIGGFGLSTATLLGNLQLIIPFNGTINEMGFLFMCVLSSIVGLYSINYTKIYKSLVYIVNKCVNNFNIF